LKFFLSCDTSHCRPAPSYLCLLLIVITGALSWIRTQFLNDKNSARCANTPDTFIGR
jgi:hypothetical protein